MPSPKSKKNSRLRNRQAPTLVGVHVSSTYDALVILSGVYTGILKMVDRRLDEEEREDIESGVVYVYEEGNGGKSSAGIERWTDGRKWSASRSKENFLFYEQNVKGSESTDENDPNLINLPSINDPIMPATDYLPSPSHMLAPDYSVFTSRITRPSAAAPLSTRLTKMTFSTWVRLPSDPPSTRRKWLLVSYWRQPEIRNLPRAYELEQLVDIEVPSGVFFSSRAGKNKQQGMPGAGQEFQGVVKRPDDLDELRRRRKEWYSSGRSGPWPTGPAARRAWPLPYNDTVTEPQTVTDLYRFSQDGRRLARRDIEDIPITLRPPHWRHAPSVGTGTGSERSGSDEGEEMARLHEHQHQYQHQPHQHQHQGQQGGHCWNCQCARDEAYQRYTPPYTDSYPPASARTPPTQPYAYAPPPPRSSSHPHPYPSHNPSHPRAPHPDTLAPIHLPPLSSLQTRDDRRLPPLPPPEVVAGRYERRGGQLERIIGGWNRKVGSTLGERPLMSI